VWEREYEEYILKEMSELNLPGEAGVSFLA
jgi:hypothetical protein